MKFFNKIAIWGLLLIVVSLQFSSVTLAAESDILNDTSKKGTILPSGSNDYDSVPECVELMNEVSKSSCRAKVKFGIKDECKEDIETALGAALDTDILACGIKTGSIHLWMIPYYIKYILTFIIGISGLACVGGIVYGGYMYLFAGVSNEKDQGKKAIQYGVIGMVMTLVAWAFVNIIIALVTG